MHVILLDAYLPKGIDVVSAFKKSELLADVKTGFVYHRPRDKTFLFCGEDFKIKTSDPERAERFMKSRLSREFTGVSVYLDGECLYSASWSEAPAKVMQEMVKKGLLLARAHLPTDGLIPLKITGDFLTVEKAVELMHSQKLQCHVLTGEVTEKSDYRYERVDESGASCIFYTTPEKMRKEILETRLDYVASFSISYRGKKVFTTTKTTEREFRRQILYALSVDWSKRDRWNADFEPSYMKGGRNG